jgi:Na+/melibiose symporter-like transporter
VKSYISLRQKLGFSAAESGIVATETFLRLYLMIYVTDTIGLSPIYAGLAITLGIVWDAITDPFMGAVSDRTLAFFKTRRPYLILGAIVLSAGLAGFFTIPAQEQGAFALVLIWYLLINTGLTILSVPFSAMVTDLSSDPSQRTQLIAFRFVFANIGAVLGTVFPIVYRSGNADPLLAALLFGILIFTTALVSYFSSPTEVKAKVVVKNVFSLQQLRSAALNRAFLPLFLIAIAATLGVAANSALALYYYKYRLLLEESQTQIIIVVFMVVLSFSLVAWLKIAKKLGKVKALMIGASGLGLFSSLLYPFLPIGSFWLPLLLGAVFLGSFVGAIILLESILTDVIDYDELLTGTNRAGLYFGLWRFGTKLARALALAFVGWSLDAIGFVPNVEQSPSTSLYLALMFGPGVGMLILFSGVLLGFYKFDDKKQKQVQKILVKKRINDELKRKYQPQKTANTSVMVPREFSATSVAHDP